MKILVVNTSEQAGGAAIAARRIMNAMMQMGHDCKMLVRDKCSDSPIVMSLPAHPLLLKWRFLWERLTIFMSNGFTREGLFNVDIANTGTDITKLPEFRQADVIHLHWVNQGFLSQNDLEHIFRSGKRIVWTMHDQWPSTAVCHYSEECENYRELCHDCPQMRKVWGSHDLSSSAFEKKLRIYDGADVKFVACSQWLERKAKQSALLRSMDVCSIPNPIDNTVFHTVDKMEARKALGLPQDCKLILFASFKVTDKRKGIVYLIEACRKLLKKGDELAGRLGIVVVGKKSDGIFDEVDLPMFSMGYVSESGRMALIYNAVDAFVTPSLQDNLPNTIMESMACGTPCVGFDVGGIPEMIDHRQNGYVARVKDADDFADGMRYVLDEENQHRLSGACLAKVQQCYSPRLIAEKYLRVYQS